MPVSEIVAIRLVLFLMKGLPSNHVIVMLATNGCLLLRIVSLVAMVILISRLMTIKVLVYVNPMQYFSQDKPNVS